MRGGSVVSSVMQKKISAAGGIPPKVLQCSALWEAISSAVTAWGGEAFSVELMPEVIQRRVLSNGAALTSISERYAFVAAEPTEGGLYAIALDRSGAAKYAASRLHQETSSLSEVSDLFLKLMVEQPARDLWKAVSDVLDRSPSEAVALSNVAGQPDTAEPNETCLLVGLRLAGGGNEDGWLLEGEIEAPEVWLVLRQSRVLEFVHKATHRGAGSSSAKHDTLRKRVRESMISLEAVLDRLPMTIGECSRLEVGQVLALPDADTGKLSLCAETVEGSLEVTHGELGGSKGHRALKLHAPVPEHVVQEIAEI